MIVCNTAPPGMKTIHNAKIGVDNCHRKEYFKKRFIGHLSVFSSPFTIFNRSNKPS
jgi:hypothetical protein